MALLLYDSLFFIEIKPTQYNAIHIFAKEFGESSYEGKQMTVPVRLADAPSGR